MPSKSLAELRDLVGETHTTVEGLTVEAGKVEEFARSVYDDNPAHRSAAAAQAQGHEGIPAPLTFTRTAYFPRYRPDGVPDLKPFDLGFEEGYVVHGTQEYEFHEPIYVGDELTGEVELTDVYQREGSRGGQMTFAVFDIRYSNADGDLVQVERQTIIETADAIDDDAGEAT